MPSSTGNKLDGKIDSSDLATSRRLRAIVQELNLKRDEEFAEIVGGERTQVNNWLNNGRPKLKHMLLLKEKYHITLDWIYAGDPSGLPHGLALRLTERLQTMPEASLKPRSRDIRA